MKLYWSDGTATIGVTDNRKRTIYIADNFNEYMRRKVLTHEFTHIMIFEYALKFDLKTEEIIADFVATYGRKTLEKVDETLKRIAYKRA